MKIGLLTSAYRGKTLTNTRVCSVLLYDPHKWHGTRPKSVMLMYQLLSVASGLQTNMTGEELLWYAA